MKKKRNHLAEIKAIAKAMGKDVLPEVKLPKKRGRRAKETKPRVMAEKKLEARIINALNLRGFTACKAGEQSTYNSMLMLPGMSDLLVFIPNYGVVFMEVKTIKGKPRISQKDFQLLCEGCRLDYTIVRSVSDAIKYCENKLDKVRQM